MNPWLEANWPAPAWLKAGTSLRSSGFSKQPFASLNLAQHVGDEAESVAQNRYFLKNKLSLPKEPLWLNQVHGNKILSVDENPRSFEADGAYTLKMGTVVAVLTADCLPLLLCDLKRRQVAAVHVGWRGLSQGIVAKAMDCFSEDKQSILAWLGPCIGEPHYEVDALVRNACLTYGEYLEEGFQATTKGHWQANLKQLLVLELQQLGLTNYYTDQSCTFAEPEKWFSYRRDGNTGRMASLIWMDEDA